MTSISTTPRERLNQVVRSHIDPFLREKGFKKKGSKYLLIGDIFSYEIDIQKTHTANHYAAFTMNYRIDSPLNIPSPFVLPVLKPALSGRVFSDNHHGFWGEFKSDDPHPEQVDNDIGNKFCHMIGSWTLPFVLSIQNLEDVIEVWADEEDKRWDTPIKSLEASKSRAVVLKYLGRIEEAVAAADKAIEQARASEKKIGRSIFVEGAKEFKGKLFTINN